MRLLARGECLEARTHASTAGLWRNDFPFLSRLECVCVCVYFTFNTHAGHNKGGGMLLKRCIEVQERLGEAVARLYNYTYQPSVKHIYLHRWLFPMLFHCCYFPLSNLCNPFLFSRSPSVPSGEKTQTVLDIFVLQ